MPRNGECQRCFGVIKVLASERARNLQSERRNALLAESRATPFPFEPLYPDRPYGLPPALAMTGRKDIWEKILKFVEDELEDVRSVSQVCVLFKGILEDQCHVAKVLQVVKACALHDATYDTYFITTKDLLHLRLASRATGKLFDKLFTEEKQDDLEDLRRLTPRLISGYELKVDNTESGQQRLQKIVASLEKHNFPKGSFPLCRLSFDEREVEDLELLELLRDLILRLMKLVGSSIRYLTYLTEEGSNFAYCTLHKYMSLLPNLQDVAIGIEGDTDVMIQPFQPFKTAPRLKTFQEIEGGFSISHLGTILRATPALRYLRIDRYPENRLDPLLSSGVLQALPVLQVLDCRQDCQKPLIERQFAWPLRTLKLNKAAGLKPIPSANLFKFINQFGSTLNGLSVLVDISFNSNGDTMLQLPHLTRLEWWLGSESERLDFIIPLKNLECLYLQVPEKFTMSDGGWKKSTLDYLERFHVPSLFPAMRQIRASIHFEASSEITIWECDRV